MPEKSAKKSKSAKSEVDLGAIPPHILNIVNTVDNKAKNRKKEHENKKQDARDSIALIRQMMSSVRTKCELTDAADEVKKDKEQDIRMIANARDIFKHLENQEESMCEKKTEKVMRVEVKPDFLLGGQNRAEEIRRERLREMAAMKAARELQLEEEERLGAIESKNRGDELRRQRETEMEIMRMQRQQALEEEEMIQEANRERFQQRQVSPGLAAARQGFRMENRDEEDKVERLRLEREREMEEMRRARAFQLEMEEDNDRMSGNRKSEATRELEAFRASQGGQGDIRGRFVPQEEEERREGGGGSRSALSRAPRAKAKVGDNWMKQREEDKLEEVRRAREREMEALMEARSQAIEEEEEERMMIEMARREEAERKGREMAMLVAELQRMRNDSSGQAEEDEKMTRYQEEMLQRVMELHAIARGGMMSN